MNCVLTHTKKKQIIVIVNISIFIASLTIQNMVVLTGIPDIAIIQGRRIVVF